MSDSLTRFETLGDLYYRRFGKLRPGKDAAAGTYESPNSLSNYDRFGKWVAGEALNDALDRIAALNEQVAQLEHRIDETGGAQC